MEKEEKQLPPLYPDLPPRSRSDSTHKSSPRSQSGRKSGAAGINKRVSGESFPQYSEVFESLYKWSADPNAIDLTVAGSISEPFPGLEKIRNNKEVFNRLISQEALHENITPELRAQLVKYLEGNGVRDVNEDHIYVDTGIFEILSKFYEASKLRLREKSVLLPIPSFGMYHTQLHKLGINRVLLPTAKENNWRIDPVKLREILANDPSIEVLLLNNPHNPTGKVMSREEMEDICEVLSDFEHVALICDEIFIDLSLKDEVKPISFASMDLPNLVIGLYGVSKTWSLAGVRLSFCYSNQDLLIKVPLMPSFNCAVVQYAMEDTLENRQYLVGNREKYLERIGRIGDYMEKINNDLSSIFDVDRKFLKFYNEIDSTSVALLDFSGLRLIRYGSGCDDTFKTSHDVGRFFYEKSGVSFVPGECFFIDPQDMVLRIILSSGDEELQRAFENMGNALCVIARDQELIDGIVYLNDRLCFSSNQKNKSFVNYVYDFSRNEKPLLDFSGLKNLIVRGKSVEDKSEYSVEKKIRLGDNNIEDFIREMLDEKIFKDNLNFVGKNQVELEDKSSLDLKGFFSKVRDYLFSRIDVELPYAVSTERDKGKFDVDIENLGLMDERMIIQDEFNKRFSGLLVLDTVSAKELDFYNLLGLELVSGGVLDTEEDVVVFIYQHFLDEVDKYDLITRQCSLDLADNFNDSKELKAFLEKVEKVVLSNIWIPSLPDKEEVKKGEFNQMINSKLFRQVDEQSSISSGEDSIIVTPNTSVGIISPVESLSSESEHELSDGESGKGSKSGGGRV